MQRRSFRLGAWLATLALLLVFVGPLVAQAVALEHVAHRHMPDCGEMDGLRLLSGHGKAAAHRSTPWAQCGYCDLLVHLPLVPLTPFAGLRQRTITRRSQRYAPLGGHARPAVFLGSRSRAPPRAAVPSSRPRTRKALP